MKKIVLSSILLIGAILLSSCSGTAARGSTSWPGLAADADNAYLADGSYVYAVSLKTGLEVWRYSNSTTKPSFFAAPVLTEDGQLLVGSEGADHALYSLDPKTGKEKWAQPFAGPQDRWLASPLVFENMIYAPNADGFLYLLDMQGSLVDSINLGGSLWSSPVTDGKQIYIASLDHHFHAVDIKTRKITQTIELEGAIPGGLTLGKDGIYFGSFSKKLDVISNGQQKALAETPNWIWGTPTLDGETLYYADLDGNVYSYDLASGKQNWTVKPDGPIVASPLIMGDKIVIVTETGIVTALDKDGKQVWNKDYETGGKIYSSVVTPNGLIVVAPVSAKFYLAAIDKDGLDAWSPFTPK